MLDEFDFERLDGPPVLSFDCGREEQNHFFQKRAWPDQQALLSTTYLLAYEAEVAGFVTLCMSGVALDRRERGRAIRYQDIAALKLAQLGIERTFQGQGLGRDAVSFAIALARWNSRTVGCRYLILDAQPDLEPWYANMGFVRNELQQQRRIFDAITHGRDPGQISVSMRYDLRIAA